MIATPDADINGNGNHSKPESGSLCVAVLTTKEAACFILGFHRPPSFDETRDDPPTLGDVDGAEIANDKVWRTPGGASFTLKRGGAAVLEGGPGTSILLNPINNTMSLRSSNLNQSADGYRSNRGRQEPGTTKSATVHREEFLHQVGPQSDRVRLSHGSLASDARRQLELAAVTTIASKQTAIIKTRETYYSDGSWIGEGPKYQFGGKGADENMVLGQQLVAEFGKLIDILKSLKVNTAWGPSTPPLPDTLTKLTQLKNEFSEKVLSKYLFITKKPPTLR